MGNPDIADDIPEDFEQKPGTLSRRIAGQREMTGIVGTLDSSFVGFGNGFIGVNQVAPSVPEEANPALSILAGALTMGVTRPAPVGIEKFVWNTETREIESQWYDATTPSFLTVPVYDRENGNLVIIGSNDGMMTIHQLDWDTGALNGKIELGRDQMFNPMAAISANPIGGDRFWLNGGMGPMIIEPKK